jgi:hypothetical protein
MKALILLAALLAALVLPPAVEARTSGGLVCHTTIFGTHTVRICKRFAPPETFVPYVPRFR